MHRGFIRLWRKSFDSDVSKNVNVWYFWCWCLHKATHKEFSAVIGYQDIKLLPGQFVFGRKKAAMETPLTEREIRTCVQFLVNSGNMTIKTTNKFSIITIINWACYQDSNFIDDQLNDQQTTNKRPTNDHIQEQQAQQEVKPPCIPPTEETEKPKRKKRVSDLPKIQLESFLKFWAVWPKHVAQADAEKAWMKISPTNGLVEVICHAVEKWKSCPKWQENNGEFIPHPATWLNGKRWRDEIKTTNAQSEYRIPIIHSGDQSIFADPE